MIVFITGASHTGKTSLLQYQWIDDKYEVNMDLWECS